MEGDTQAYEEASEEGFCHAVDEMMDYLTNTLHTTVDDLLTKLYGEFQLEERQNIDASRTAAEKVKTFFEALKTKSVGAHQKCLTVLGELKRRDVANKLKEKMNNYSPRKIAGEQTINT